MESYLENEFGNPSSLHAWGRRAREAVEAARERIAHLLHVRPDEVIFTSGGTESDNLAIKGVALALREQGRHIITSSIEHHAVLHSCEALEKWGFEITYLPVDGRGRVSADAVQRAIRPDTILVTIQAGNNEVGTRQPVGKIGEICRKRKVLFHTDAVQAVETGKMDLSSLPVDLASFSAHKINGPKGVGALYVRKGTPLHPLLHGGAQEQKRRAGTENVAGIVGFAKAFELFFAEGERRKADSLRFRSTLIQQFMKDGLTYFINGDEEEFLPHILNVSFPGVSRDTLLIRLDMEGIAASAGSACTAGSLLPSHVLKAMGVSEERLTSAIRFSFGYGNSQAQLEEAAVKIGKIIHALSGPKEIFSP